MGNVKRETALTPAIGGEGWDEGAHYSPFTFHVTEGET